MVKDFKQVINILMDKKLDLKKEIENESTGNFFKRINKSKVKEINCAIKILRTMHSN